MSGQQAASSKQLSGSLGLSLDQAVEDSAEFLRVANEGAAEGQAPLTCQFEPVLRLVERTAGDEEEAPLIGESPSSKSFRDIRTDRIGCADKLGSSRPEVELGPIDDFRVNRVGEFRRQAIRSEASMPTSPHCSRNPAATDRRPLLPDSAARCLLLAAC